MGRAPSLPSTLSHVLAQLHPAAFFLPRGSSWALLLLPGDLTLEACLPALRCGPPPLVLKL